MPKGTIFEHNYGTYKVESIYIDAGQIVVSCERYNKKKPFFDALFQIMKNLN